MKISRNEELLLLLKDVKDVYSAYPEIVAEIEMNFGINQKKQKGCNENQKTVLVKMKKIWSDIHLDQFGDSDVAEKMSEVLFPVYTYFGIDWLE